MAEAEQRPRPMLSSRSARLAAILLLTLLCGWTVRAYRKGTTTLPVSPPAAKSTLDALPKNSFPDE